MRGTVWVHLPFPFSFTIQSLNSPYPFIFFCTYGVSICWFQLRCLLSVHKAFLAWLFPASHSLPNWMKAYGTRVPATGNSPRLFIRFKIFFKAWRKFHFFLFEGTYF
jgi:hypothetical protein